MNAWAILAVVVVAVVVTLELLDRFGPGVAWWSTARGWVFAGAAFVLGLLIPAALRKSRPEPPPVPDDDPTPRTPFEREHDATDAAIRDMDDRVSDADGGEPVAGSDPDAAADIRAWATDDD